jgi:hypothetical protein
MRLAKYPFFFHCGECNGSLQAYMLYDGAGSNPFKTTVIDTIVAEIQSVPGEDRCVLLLGYRDQMMEMFQVD